VLVAVVYFASEVLFVGEVRGLVSMHKVILIRQRNIAENASTLMMLSAAKKKMADSTSER